MIAAQQLQERRLDELLRRQLGTRILAAIGDPQITEIIVNEDGRIWFESYGKGMHEAGLRLAASQVESLIGTVAASLGTVANASNPIVEGELQIEGIRFEGLLPPVARKPCCVMRKPAQVLHSLDDYIRDGILQEVHARVLREPASCTRLESLVSAAQSTNGATVNFIFGEGVSPSFRAIRDGLDELGLPSDQLLNHGSPKIAYGASLASNMLEYLLGMHPEPNYFMPMMDPERQTDKIAGWWTQRWLCGRIQREDVLAQVESETIIHPIRHAARVRLPEIDSDQLQMFDN
jgi:hypothetical protein